MTAREAIHALLTAYLVSVLTLAWLAAVGALFWALGAVWGPVLAGALGWLQVWGPAAGLAILGALMVAMVVGASLPLLVDALRDCRGGRC